MTGRFCDLAPELWAVAPIPISVCRGCVVISSFLYPAPMVPPAQFPGQAHCLPADMEAGFSLLCCKVAGAKHLELQKRQVGFEVVDDSKSLRYQSTP